MTFQEALKALNIEEYEKRIFDSNSKGELFHLRDYIMLAEMAEGRDPAEFRKWFIDTVTWAEKTWDRPESVFQHIPTLLFGSEEGEAK
jgi:hypothetical protein